MRIVPHFKHRLFPESPVNQFFFLTLTGCEDLSLRIQNHGCPWKGEAVFRLARGVAGHNKNAVVIGPGRKITKPSPPFFTPRFPR